VKSRITKRSQKSIIQATNDGFVNLTARLGLGADNQISQGHYAFGPFISRNRTELEAAYRSSWIVGQVVDTISEDMTRSGIDIESKLTPDQIKKLYRGLLTFRIWHQLCNALKWSRLYGGCLAVLIIDGQDFKTPLRMETIRKGQFKGLLVLDRWLVWPSLDNLITEMGVDLGMPKYYTVIGDSAALPNIKIHHSRCLRFDGIELPYYQKLAENLWGESVIERLLDRLVAFDSVTHGAAQLVFKAHLRGIGVKGLREALSIGGKAEEAIIKMFDYIRLLQSNEGLTLLDADDQFWTHQYTFTGLADMIIQAGQQLSGATGIPLVRLFGQSPAGLSSTGESDLRNYYDHVNKLQENQLRGPVETLLNVLSMSELGAPLPDDFDFTFNPLWLLDDKERADLAKTDSDSVSELYNDGIITHKMALKELKQASRTTGRFTNITDEDIERADDEFEKKGEFGMMGGGLPGLEGTDETGKRKQASRALDSITSPRRSWRKS
jgi:hypothetical protein